MASSILVVEDDDNQREFLEKLLSESGYFVQAAPTGSEALALLEKSSPDLVILDLGLPDIEGETVFSEVRKDFPSMPVIILTARGTSAEIVKGLNLGADDYIAKPYNADELLARVRVRLRPAKQTDKLKVADLEVDTKTFEVQRGSRKIHLTPKEFKLLEILIANKGKVLSRDMILSRIWFYSPDMQSRAVDVYVGYLRKKIDSGFKKQLIQSVRGYGYMIRE